MDNDDDNSRRSTCCRKAKDDKTGSCAIVNAQIKASSDRRIGKIEGFIISCEPRIRIWHPTESIDAGTIWTAGSRVSFSNHAPGISKFINSSSLALLLPYHHFVVSASFYSFHFCSSCRVTQYYNVATHDSLTRDWAVRVCWSVCGWCHSLFLLVRDDGWSWPRQSQYGKFFIICSWIWFFSPRQVS